MSSNVALVAARIALLVDRELVNDGVEIWTLFWHVRRLVDRASDDEILEIVDAALRALLLSGVRVGEIDDRSGRFHLWADQDSADRLMKAIRDLGREPNMGDVGWLVRDVYP
ncbi:hypothetical protein [Promicromonospora sukumoe]|uniref:hypothetical protein n=1 Tax=Promicromonospora sukumoe TaxID=88382 RepID=UPI0012F93E49|nr:hypothetical protein [Promicromonospora sukumoe]